jgi:hypothetical protein
MGMQEGYRHLAQRSRQMPHAPHFSIRYGETPWAGAGITNEYEALGRNAVFCLVT